MTMTNSQEENRKARLRALLPEGADDQLIASLAALPDPGLILQALKQARRAGVRAGCPECARRKQARQDRKAHPCMDEAQHAAMVGRIVAATGRRASKDPRALATLTAARVRVEESITAAALHLHEQGVSDGEIGAQLGMTKQAVQQRRQRAQFDAEASGAPALILTRAGPRTPVRRQACLSAVAA
jgi:hypothetical protein